MKFVTINPADKTVNVVEFKDLHDAIRSVGISPYQVDHGAIRLRVNGSTQHGIGIVVYEFGLYDPPSKQKYFAIGGSLYAGNAVLYGVGEAGETVDIIGRPEIVFIDDPEAAINRGEIRRPNIAVNGTVLWQWPQKVPF